MATFANIVAFDGASTPVSHTLKPASLINDKGEWTAIWREDLAGVPVYAQVNMSAKMKQLPSGTVRVQVRVSVPTMEAVSGQNAAGYTAAPAVAFTDDEEYIVYAHPRSTTTGRRLCRQLTANIINGVTTSVAPTTAGQIQELVDSLFMPN